MRAELECSRVAKIGAEIIPGLLASIRKAISERRAYAKPPKSRGIKKRV